MPPLHLRFAVSVLLTLVAHAPAALGQTLPAAPELTEVGARQSFLAYTDAARALLTLKDYQTQVENGTNAEERRAQVRKEEILAAMRILEYLPSPQAIEALVQNMDFDSRIYMRANDTRLRRPAVAALIEHGGMARPFIVKEIVDIPRPRRYLHQAPDILNYLALGPLLRKPSVADRLNHTLLPYASDYHRQALSLRALAKKVPGTVAAPPDTPTQQGTGEAQSNRVTGVPRLHISDHVIGWNPVPILRTVPTTDERIPRLARILELQDIVLDESAEANEARSIAAITELGKLRAVEAAPALADKLDWQVGPGFPEDKQIPPTNAVRINGKVSPAITEAAKVALEQIGTEALPAVMDASSMQYRLTRFGDNALQLIVKLTGGEEQAQAALEAAAQEDEAKQQRLLDWLKKVNAPTPNK